MVAAGQPIRLRIRACRPFLIACAAAASIAHLPAGAQDALDRELHQHVQQHIERRDQGLVESTASLEGRQVIFTRELRTKATTLAAQTKARFEKEVRPQMLREAGSQLRPPNANKAGVSIKYVYNNLTEPTSRRFSRMEARAAASEIPAAQA